MKILRPISSNCWISQSFDEHQAYARENKLCSTPLPKSKCPRGYYYGGIDYVTTPPIGHPVTAAASGKVDEIYNQANGYGIGVKLLHNATLNSKTVHTIYAHLSSTAVRAGQTVAAGALLGHTGWTGNVRDMQGNRSPAAAHLHFELRIGGVPADPELYYAADIAEVVEPEPPFALPEIPTLPSARVSSLISYNIRIRASIGGSVVGYLSPGQVVNVASFKLDSESVWFLVITPTVAGWAAARYMGNDWILPEK